MISRLAPALLFVSTQVLYLLTLHRGLPPRDSGDFITAALTRGLPHPPGYPFATLAGIAFSYLPFGSPEARINYLSAFCAGVAVVLAYLAGLTLGASRWAAVAAALTLAVGSIFWRYAVIADVFSLHAAIAAALIWTVLLYRKHGGTRLLWGAALLFGLGVSHLHTIILLAPALLWLVLSGRPAPRSPAFWGGALVALLIGLSPYLYLPYAAMGPANLIEPTTWSSFWDVFLRRAYGVMALSQYAEGNRLVNMLAQIKILGVALLRDQMYIGLPISLFGLGVLYRQDRQVFVGLIGYLALNLPFFLWLANAPATENFSEALQAQYGGPIFVLTVAMAVGVARAARGAERFIGGKHAETICAVLAFLLPASMLVANYARRDKSKDAAAERMGRLVLESVAPNAVVFFCYDTMNFTLRELQHVHKLRPDVVLSSFNPRHTEAARIRARLAGWELPLTDSVPFTRSLIARAQRTNPVYLTFAGRCNDSAMLGGLENQIVPEGLVYRLVPARTPAVALEGARRGLRLLATRPEMATARVSEQADYGNREIVNWYADAYANIGVMLAGLGRDAEAKALFSRAEAMRR